MKRLLEADVVKYQKMRKLAVDDGDDYAVTVIDFQICRIRAILEENKEQEMAYARIIWTMQEQGR